MADKFHVSETRGAEKCPALKRCRLGWSLDEHPSTPEEALAHYNKKLEDELDHLRSIKADPKANRKFLMGEISDNPKYIDQTIARREKARENAAAATAENIKKMNEEASRKKKIAGVKPQGVSWTEWKAPEKSEIIVEPKVNDPQGGYLGGRLWVGGKSEGVGYGEQTKLVRLDLKEAVAKGELPKDIALSVKTDGGSTIVKIGLKVNGKSQPWPSEEEVPGSEQKYNELRKYIEKVGAQYSYEDVNSMVDYFNYSNVTRVGTLSKWDIKR